jgi:tetratricopeptide (TPR) repeat protein
MRVTARSSVFRYKARAVDPQEAGRDLAVRAILVGRVDMRDGDLAVSVELVNVRDNTRIWGQEYRRRADDALAIQVAISADIADTLRVRLSPDEHRRLTGSSQNKEAYQLFLKGRYYWNKRNKDAMQQAIGYYQQAIDKDPTYAMAYVGLADCYNAIWVYTGVSNSDAHLRAKKATERALEIDENLAEAYASRASNEHDYEWNFPAAERDFQKAIALNPSHATARQWYAEFLAAMGRSEEAIAQIGRAQEVDPLSSIIATVSGKIYKLAGQHDRAIAVLRKAIESDNAFYVSHISLSEVFIEKGMFRESIAEYQTALTLAGEPQEAAAERASLLLGAFSTGGPGAYWRERLALARRDIDTQHSLPYRISDASPYHLAALNARLGERAAMLAELDRALSDREPHLINVMVDSAFVKYRNDPRLLDIARRAGLRP